MLSAGPVCSCAHSYAQLHTRPRVQRAPGLPCALILEGKEISGKARAQCVARMRTCVLDEHCRRPGLELRCAIAHRGTHTPRPELLERTKSTVRETTADCGYGSRLKAGTTTNMWLHVISFQTADARSPSRGALRPSFAGKLPALQTEGAGKTGCALHPRSRVRLAQNKVHTSIQGSGEHPAFPAQWLYGL